MASYFEQRGGTYTPVNGVLLPDLVLDAPPPGPLGKFGRMRKRYLEQKHDGTFTALVLSGKLNEHLLEIDRAAREQLEATVSHLAAAEQDGHKKVYQATTPFSTSFAACAVKRFAGWRRMANLGEREEHEVWEIQGSPS